MENVTQEDQERDRIKTDIRKLCCEGGKVDGSGSGSGLWYQRAEASRSVTQVFVDYWVYGRIKIATANKVEK
jgi:hypothetical protein